MLAIFYLVAAYSAAAANHDQFAPDPYGAKGPCAYIFQEPGGKCLDGSFTVEVEIGPEAQLVAAKVVSASASEKSSGPVDAIAQCVASNMSFYRKAYLKPPITPGKRLTTIHVVNANTCPEP
jgi:hypothetical protein